MDAKTANQLVRLDPEIERSITRKLLKQNDMNMRVTSLIHESDQSMNEHRKFKQLIGYKDKNKVVMSGGSTTMMMPKRSTAAIGAGRFDVGDGIAVGTSQEVSLVPDGRKLLNSEDLIDVALEEELKRGSI